MKFDYKKIKSQDALELAKYMVLDDIHKSTKRALPPIALLPTKL